jgi:hypothetical protein
MTRKRGRRLEHELSEITCLAILFFSLDITKAAEVSECCPTQVLRYRMPPNSQIELLQG